MPDSRDWFPVSSGNACPPPKIGNPHQYMTQTRDNDTDGLMSVRDVCNEYEITRAQAVNIMFQLPIKLQRDRANWYAIEDVEDLMERHRYMWDRDYYKRE